MIWFEELQNRKKISRIFSRYERTFPEEERRNREQFLALAEHPDAFVYLLHEEDENIGYAIIWELQNTFFLEHFEIFEDFRNGGLGGSTLEAMKEKFGKIVLETEPDTLSEIAKKRVDFYQRNGFNMIKQNYLQPSYGEGKPAVHLFLMANFQTENLESIVQEIYEVVYEHPSQKE